MNSTEPATAITAASLLANLGRSQLLQHHNTNAIPTSCTIIDDFTLADHAGGFPYGRVTAIEGAKNCGKSLIAMHAVTSHLLANPEGQVAWIDTTNTFSAALLLKVVQNRLLQQEAPQEVGDSYGFYEPRKGSKKALRNPVVEKKAESLLGRVQVMRVFDIYGVLEALEEVQSGFRQVDCVREEASRAKEKGNVILDSQGYDDEDIIESVELVDINEKPRNGGQEQETDSAVVMGVGVIVINTISIPVTLLMEKGEAQGNALLEVFSRSLSSLAQDRNISILLLSTSTNTPSVRQNPNPMYPQFTPPAPLNLIPSVFSAVTPLCSGMGSVLSYGIDLCLLVSRFPIGLNEQQQQQQPNGVRQRNYAKSTFSELDEEAVLVIEVVRDRYSTGIGKWATFKTKGGVLLIDVVP